MRFRRADVFRVPAALWFVVALQGVAAPPLGIAAAAARGRASAGLDDVDLDAPDLGKVAPPKAPVDAGVPAASASPAPPASTTPSPDGGTPSPNDPSPDAPASTATSAPPPTTVGKTAPDDDAASSFFAVHPWKRSELLAAAAAHFAPGVPEASRAQRTLGDLERALTEAGVHGLPGGASSSSVGAALAREAETLAAAGDTARSLDVADLALRAAPDDTAVAARAAHVRWRAHGFSAAGDVVDVARRALHEPLRAGDVVVRVAGATVVVVLALLATLALALAVPALRLLGFDLWLLLPRGSHRAQGLAFAALLAVVPAVVGAGVVVTGLWLVTLAFVYLRRSARVWAAIVGLLVAALPLVVEVYARAAVVAGADVDVIAAALYDVDADDARAALLAREARGEELPLLARAALAAAAHREGRVDEAVDRWRALAEKNPEVGWVHGGYGVALATAARDEVARSELVLCAERSVRDPDIAAVAAFDASVLLQQAGRSDRAQAMVNGAVPSSAGLMAAARRATFRNPDEVVSHNRAFAGILPPRRLLLELARAPTPASTALAAAIARPLWGNRLPGPAATALLAAFLVAWAVLAALAPRLRPARACVRCGAPASRRVDARDVPENTCSACFHVFLSKKSRVDPAVKLRRERLILVRGRVRSALVVLLSLWPGTGHLFAGAVARGALLLVLSTSAVVGVVAVSDVAPGPAPSGPWSAWLEAAPFLAVAAFVFLVSLRGALAIADDERAGGVR